MPSVPRSRFARCTAHISTLAQGPAFCQRSNSVRSSYSAGTGSLPGSYRIHVFTLAVVSAVMAAESARLAWRTVICDILICSCGCWHRILAGSQYIGQRDLRIALWEERAQQRRVALVVARTGAVEPVPARDQAGDDGRRGFQLDQLVLVSRAKVDLALVVFGAEDKLESARGVGAVQAAFFQRGPQPVQRLSEIMHAHHPRPGRGPQARAPHQRVRHERALWMNVQPDPVSAKHPRIVPDGSDQRFDPVGMIARGFDHAKRGGVALAEPVDRPLADQPCVRDDF